MKTLSILGLAAAGFAVFCPATAAAQDGGITGSSGYGISLASSVVQRYYPPPGAANPYPVRAANLNPNDINFQDCEDNIHLVFNMLETGGGPTSAPDILQVWAGTTDCTLTSARSGGLPPFCWQVAAAQEGIVTTATFDIYARDLTRYIDATLDSVPNAGNPVVGSGQPESACHTQTSSGQVALNIYFMFLPNTGDATPDASFSYSLNVDLVGPLAPYNLTAGIGDQLLLLNWSSQIDPTIQGFNIYAEDQGTNGLAAGSEGGATTVTTPIYCEQGGATTCVDSGGAADDASVDACTTTYQDAPAYTEVLDASSYGDLSDADLASMGCVRASPVKGVTTGPLNGAACTSTVLVDKFTSNVTLTTTEEGGVGSVDGGGVTPIVTSVDGAGATGLVGISQIDASAYGVGNVGGNTTSSFNVETLPGGMRLIDGHQYAVAVAAYDDDGNVGLLSNLVCQTPEPIVDFWDRYGVAGGTAGGGFCALEAPGVPVAGSMFGMGVGVAMLAFARRRRRKTS